MSLIAVTSSQGLSVLSSAILRATYPDPAPNHTTTLTPPSRIPSGCISWSPDASSVFVASGGSVSAYDAATGAWQHDVVREGEGGIGGAKLGSMAVLQSAPGSGPVLAFARGARAVLFDSETRRAVLTVEGHKSSIFAMSVACDQSLLATSSAETTMVTNLVQQSTTVLRGAPPGATAAAFHPTQRTTLLVLSPRGLCVFDTTKGASPTRTIPIGKAEGGGGCIAFSPCSPALVAIVIPGGGGRVLMLDIEKESSLVKKFTVEENVTAMSFSHDGGSIIVGTEGGRVLQLNLRSIDKPAQAVTVDPTGGRIGGLAIAVTSTLRASRPAANPSASTTTVPSVRQSTRSTRTESVTSASTSDSARVRVRASTADLRGTLRTKPSMDVLAKSPDPVRTATTSTTPKSPDSLRKSPDVLRTRASTIELRSRPSAPDLRSKVSPGVLRVKPGLENKARPVSMISASGGKEKPRTRVKPVSLVEEKIGAEERDVLAELKTKTNEPVIKGTPSPGSKVGTISGELPPLSRLDKESTISPSSRRQTQTMPRRLTTDGARRPTLSQVFAHDDLGATPARSRSSSSAAGTPFQNLSSSSNTPISARPPLLSTTPNYTPGAGAGAVQTETTTPDHSPEDITLVPRVGESIRERPRSRLGEERPKSRAGEDRPRSRIGGEDRPRSRIGLEDRPLSRIGEDRPLGRLEEDKPLSSVGSEGGDRERPASRLLRDETDRPASRVSGTGTLGLGRPSGLARRLSTDFRISPETLRMASDMGGSVRERTVSALGREREGARERVESLFRERPESALRERPESIFRERVDSVVRDRPESVLRERSGTPSSMSGRTPGKRVGWVDEESPYVDGPHEAVCTPARPRRSGLASVSASGSEPGSASSDSSEGERRKALLVTPRRGLAAALGAEVYAGDVPMGRSNQGKSSTITQTQAQDLLRNIVSDVMFEYRQEAREDVRGLHLDLIRASRGWKSDLKQYLGDTLEELQELKEENARLRAENARLRRGY